MGCAPSSQASSSNPKGVTQNEEVASEKAVNKPVVKAEPKPKPAAAVPEPKPAVEEHSQSGENVDTDVEKKVQEPIETPVEMDGPVTQDEKKTVMEKAGLGDSTLSFDAAFALEQVDGDVEFLEELKDSVVELQEETAKSLPQALADKQWKMMFEKAHALKGAVANLGMERLRLLALSVEQSGRCLNEEKDAAYSNRELQVLIELISDEWVVFHAAFAKEIEKVGSS